MEETVTFNDAVKILLKNLALILAVSIICAAVMFAYSSFFIKDTYTTSISIIVHNAKTPTATTSSYNDMSAAELLSNQFIEILGNKAILKSIAAAVGDDPLTGKPKVTADKLKKYITFSSSSNAIIKVKVTCPDPDLCVDICEATATAGADLLKEKVEASSIQRIESTRADISEPEPVSKGKLTKTVGGFLVGFIVTYVIVFIIAYTDTTVKTGTEINRKFNIPILGNIPTITDNNNPVGNRG